MHNSSEIMQLCRLCLVKDQVNISIFDEQGDIRQIFLKISACLPVKVSREDKLPKKICDGCSYKLDLLYEFWNTSANAEKQLLTWLGQAGLKANTQMTDETMSVVAQQITNKPADAVVKQENVDSTDIHADEENDNSNFMAFQQKFNYADEAGTSAQENADEEDLPPRKRSRRAAAMKKPITISPETDEEDDVDSVEPMTKLEDESDDSDCDGDEPEPAFVDVPSTSVEDQPGPSGLGKEGVEAPLTNGNVDLECYLCNKVFQNEGSLKAHIENLEGYLKAFCKFCKNFVRCEEAMFHFDITYSCIACKLILSEDTYLLHKCLHKQANQEIAMTKRRECGICERIFFCEEDIANHIRENHTSLLRDKFCKCCRVRFESNEDYTHHQRLHATDKCSMPQHDCTLCDMSFGQENDLTLHTKIVHTKRISNKKPNQRTCPSRKAATGRNNNVPKKNNCDVCHKTFNTTGTLKTHQKLHLNAFKCTACPKSFKTKKSRNAHFASHAKKKRK